MNYTIRTTAIFDDWLSSIKDKKTRYRLDARFDRILEGRFGDYKSIATNLYELRCFFAGGLRIYFTIHEETVVILMCAGNKASQSRDIKRAHQLLMQLMD